LISSIFKNTLKIYPKDILHDKATFTELVHLTSNVAFKTRKHFQMAGDTELKKKLKFHLTT